VSEPETGGNGPVRPEPEIAVALRYDGTGAPVVTAKGRGEIAGLIIAKAREHDIPLREEPELVKLLAKVPLGDEIPRELYVAVAEVIAFAYSLTGRQPGDRREPPARPV
jgi:flagellar biosynthesis protein